MSQEDQTKRNVTGPASVGSPEQDARNVTGPAGEQEDDEADPKKEGRKYLRVPREYHDNLVAIGRELALMGIRSVEGAEEEGRCPLCGEAQHEAPLNGCAYLSLPRESRSGRHTSQQVAILAADTLARALREAAKRMKLHRP